jgi:hypothetical protein
MSARILLATSLLAASALLGGCATSRSELLFAAPAAKVATVNPQARPVVIRQVLDERVFEQAPPEPSTPSLGFEGADAAPADVKARAIGRKRNTYGKALGDVVLPAGQTVTSLVRDNLAVAFQDAGWRVVTDPAAAPGAMTVDVPVRRFWSWFQPGFWAITLNADIETTLDLSGGGLAEPVVVHVDESRMGATDDAWKEIIDKALTAYRAAVGARLQALPR